MAKIFLDANYFIDLVEQRKPTAINAFQDQTLFLSPLSIHILIYVYKYQIPNNNLVEFQKYFNLVPWESTITYKSLLGPTKDFEDNVQLHSASQTECDFFLTEDKKLLGLNFFGKMQIDKHF